MTKARRRSRIHTKVGWKDICPTCVNYDYLITLPTATIAVSTELRRVFFVPLIEWTRKMLPMISDVKPISRSIRYNEWFQGDLRGNILGEAV